MWSNKRTADVTTFRRSPSLRAHLGRRQYRLVAAVDPSVQIHYILVANWRRPAAITVTSSPRQLEQHDVGMLLQLLQDDVMPVQ
jgi:hypothetical protein